MRHEPGHGLEALLARQSVVILDGGLATELEARGCVLDPELWSAGLLLDRPEELRRVHLDYLRAGADVIVSASYQATIAGFERRGLSRSEAEDVMRLSVELALDARSEFCQAGGVGTGRERPLVAASIGPYGAALADGSEYRGDYGLGASALRDFHGPRLEVLAGAGADLLAFETLPSAVEARVVAELLEEVPGARAWISFSCRDGSRISDGTPITEAAAPLEVVAGVLAVGVNCTAPRHLAEALGALRAATTKPLAAYPNSGEGYDAAVGRWSGTADLDLAAAAPEWAAAGARLIGGCCRTGPDDIRRLRQALLNH